MKFAFLNDQDTLYFFPANELENASLPIQAMDGARYIFTEHSGAEVAETVAAERVDNDLHLRLGHDPLAPSNIVLNDFFLADASVHSLSESGEYRLQITSDNSIAQGPVALANENLGAQQDQAEAPFLKVIQRAAIVEAVEEQLAVFNANDTAAKAQAHTVALEGPMQLMDAPAQFSVAPEITAVYDNVGSKTGPIQLDPQQGVSIIDDKKPIFEGTGEPNSTLQLLHNGVPILTVEVDAQGHWSVQLSVPLAEGAQFFSVRDITSELSSNTIAAIVDTVAPGQASIKQVTQDHTGTPLSIASGGYTGDNTPLLSGKADASTLVTIYNGNVEIGATVSNAQGEWSFTRVNPPLPDGEYTFRVVAQDASGNIGLRSRPFTVTIDTLAPDQPQILEVLDDVGASTGLLLDGARTDDDTPTLKGNAEPFSTVHILDGGKEIGTATADANGNWSFTPEEPLAEGSHSFTVIATDRVGNESPASLPWSVTIVLGAPEMPVIESVIDDAGALHGPLENGDITDDSTPTFKGTAEPGSTIYVYDHDQLIGEVEVDDQGNWVFTPTLEDGEHQLTFESVNGAGNHSEMSPPWAVTVDTQAPDAPTIGGVYDDVGAVIGELVSGAVTDDTQPTLTGQAEAGAIVSIFDGEEKLGEVQADENGNWSFTPEEALSEGEHSFTVRAQDAAGNLSEPSQPWEVVIDTTAPVKPGSEGSNTDISEVIDDHGPIQGPIEQGGVTDDTTPTFNGTGEPGETIIIRDGEEEIGRADVDSEGNWSFTPEEPLAEGEHEISVIVQDEAGNQSEPSDPWIVTVDTQAPDAPTIGGVYDDVGAVIGELVSGAVTDDTQPTLTGQAEAGAIVSIFDGEEKLGEVQADENGNWSFTPEEALSEGEHSFTVRAQDVAGNLSEPSQPWDVVIDTTAPVKPGSEGSNTDISEVIDDHGPIQGPIEQGDVTDDNTPTFNGTGDVGDTIIIRDGEEEIGRVEVDSEGNWSFTPEEPLADGEHEISVIVQDEAGNQSEPSDPWIVTVDTQAPDAPTIGSVYDDVGAVVGELVSGAVTDDTQPTFTGQAEAGAIVSIFDGEEKLGEVQADENGNWSFTPEEALSEGEHSFTVRAQDAAGNLSEPSQPWEVVIDTTAPVKPGSEGSNTDISEVIDDHGPIQGPIEQGGVTDDTTPTFNGTGEPGDTIIIRDGEEEIGRADVDSEGNWSFTPEEPLAEGEHEISVIVQDEAGNQSEPSDPWIVTVDTQAPDAPTIGAVYDDVGAVTGELVSGAVTDDTQPTLTGQAEAGAIVSIFDGEEKLGEVQADENGNWSFTPEEALSEGEHSFTVRAQDVAGNLSEPSQPWEVVIDTTAPVKPGSEGSNTDISEVIDDHGPIQGPIEQGGVTDDTTPTFNGTGEPGDTIIIRDGEEEIGRADVDSEGNWSFTPEEPLAEGEHEISVIVQDPAGNQSEPSDPWIVTVDTQAPDAPTIGAVYDDEGAVTGELASGDTTDDQRPTFSGQAEAGSVVTIYDHGNALGEARADENGNWTFTPEEALADGEHSFTVKAMDAAGNESEESMPWLTTIVTQTPEQPTIGSVTDDVGPLTGALHSGDVTDDSRPQISGLADPGVTVHIYDRGVELGSVQADENGNWSFTPEQELVDGEYSFSAVAENSAGTRSPASESFDLIIYTGNGPTQVARLSHMGKDSGQDGHDFVTDNGTYGRLMHGLLSAELAAGQTLQVSTDGGKTWFDALVDGTNWAAQDRSSHTGNWNIQTRVVDQAGNSGYVMQQAVVLDTLAPRAPSSIQLDGSHLQVGFDASNVAVGDRIAIIADGGAQRFEHTLTQEDIAAGFVNLEVGSISSASAAIVDQAGNLSGFANTGAAPSVNYLLTGDVTEVYGQGRDNVFSIQDVSVLDQIKVIEGNGGVDTLRLLGADQVLDLSALQGRLSSIEVIDLTGCGNNTLKVSLGDVLELGNQRSFINDDNVQLAIKGDAGDVVMLNDLLPNGMDVGDWENVGYVTSAGIQYDVYQHSALEAEILVQQGVTVQTA
ncbi:Ig-like domain-containing protein [Pseudomonas putida]|uniref:Ig-like domain-containing protein n=1 Tax=Pseudomonas putida TaxID=303 RepID=UPI00300E8326